MTDFSPRLSQNLAKLPPYLFARIDALKADGIDRLLNRIVDYLPEGPRYYPEDMVTDLYERFMAAEIIREKIFEKYQQEIPYSTAVDIAEFKEREGGKTFISADIYVERDSQKGKGGTRAGKKTADENVPHSLTWTPHRQ